jgi:hypothetical protein
MSGGRFLTSSSQANVQHAIGPGNFEIAGNGTLEKPTQGYRGHPETLGKQADILHEMAGFEQEKAKPSIRVLAEDARPIPHDDKKK